MTYPNPGIYPDIDEVIPHSPRRQFGFASSVSEATSDKIIKLESMENMSIDYIVELYKNGYMIEGNTNNLSPNIVTAQGVSVSTGAIFLIGLGILAYIVYKKGSFRIK